MSDQPVLTVDDLYVDVTTATGRIPILQGVSFQLRAGQVFGLVGESGSGKTMTCLSVLNLLPRKSEVRQGSIKLKNQELLGLPERGMRQIRGKELAVVMQNPMAAFNPVVTIGQHFVETLRCHLPVTVKEAQEIAIHHLRALELPRAEQLLKQYPFQLSGGMLQRVMIAIAVSLKPTVLITDEPTTALDTIAQLQILDHLDWVRAEYSTAIMLVSHDLGAVARLADHVGVMYGGRIVENAPTQVLFSRPQHAYTRALLGVRRSRNGKKLAEG